MISAHSAWPWLRPLAVLTIGLALCACNTTTVRTTRVLESEVAAPASEADLLDVGIGHFTTSLTEASDSVGTPGIRAAEGRYLPRLLMQTLQSSGQWGAVRVIPDGISEADVTVDAEILHSDGQQLELAVTVSDSTGARWYQKRYAGTASKYAYDPQLMRRADPFQAVYTEIANDLLDAARSQPAGTAEYLRTVSELRFAQRLLPEAFDEYLARDADGVWQVDRLPAESDPNLVRIRRVRERDFLFVDTLQAYYDEFADSVAEPYFQWRNEVLFEAQAQQEMEDKATARQIGGALAIIGGVAGALAGTSLGTAAAIVGGTSGLALIRSAGGARAEARFHAAAVEELAKTLDADLVPQTLALDDRTVTLEGSVAEQYAQWQDLLRQLYAEETGLPITADASPDAELQDERID